MDTSAILAEYNEYAASFPNIRTFHEHMNEFVQREQWDTRKFADETGLSNSMFTRLTKYPDERFDKRTVVAMCIGLKKGLSITEEMLSLQGHCLSKAQGQKTDRAYRFLFEKGYYLQGIETCNKILKALGVPKSKRFGADND